MKNKPTVFVIDPQGDVRRAVWRAMSDQACQTDVFASAEEFLSLACSHETSRTLFRRPACLIVEVNLPGMTGLDLQQDLRGQQYSLPFIFVDTPGQVDAAVLATKRGALDYLEKPLEIARLADTIRAGWATDEQQRAADDRKRETVLRLAALTGRERQVLDALLARESPKRIAALLGTSPHTVRNQRASILRKMGAEDDAELISMLLLSERKVVP